MPVLLYTNSTIVCSRKNCDFGKNRNNVSCRGSGAACRLHYNAQTPYTMLHVQTLYLSQALVTDFNLSPNLIVRFENIRFIYDPITTCVFVHF
jgi:hypothetical protein